MNNPFVRKLRSFATLSPGDVDELLSASSTVREFGPRQDLIREGDLPGPLFCFVEGWGCRYAMLPEGTRQITALLMPGDHCDMHAGMLKEMDHSIATLTAAKVALISRTRIDQLIETRPQIARAFWASQLVDEATMRAWIISMGRRDSLTRVAHLMCELYVRARTMGLTDEGRLDLPLTQIVLGDALGLTPVHVNRVLRRLRLTGVMELSSGLLTISDPDRLAQIAGFDDNYLHRRLRRVA